MNHIGTFKIFNTSVCILMTQYANNNATALQLVCEEDDEPWGTLTVNVPGTQLAENELLVKTWDENQPMREPALACGLFQDTGRRIRCGFTEAEVWRWSANQQPAIRPESIVLDYDELHAHG